MQGAQVPVEVKNDPTPHWVHTWLALQLKQLDIPQGAQLETLVKK